MSYRVGIASSDGKYVNQHFGHATQFLIFEIADGGYRFVELRSNEPSCNREDPNENAHDRVIENLKDCRAVIVSQIGPGAVARLRSAGIEAWVIPDFIDEVLERLVQSPGQE